jgi:hypothetical protein
MATLFDTLSADGDSVKTITVGGDKDVTFFASGPFSSGTLVLEFRALIDNTDTHTDWETVTGTSLTAAGQVDVALKGPCEIRSSLSGSTTPTVVSGIL